MLAGKPRLLKKAVYAGLRPSADPGRQILPSGSQVLSRPHISDPGYSHPPLSVGIPAAAWDDGGDGMIRGRRHLFSEPIMLQYTYPG